MITVRRSSSFKREGHRLLAALLAALLVPLPVMPQQPVMHQDSAAAVSAEQNMARVAASAAQISDVLRKDAGLMVELKGWVAKEATERGQILEDSDLTDLAIFKRLENDLEFRSVATRLVQRYGYLLPKFNPESDAAKEREILLQERTKRLARAEAEEEEEARRRRQEELNRASAQLDDRRPPRQQQPESIRQRGTEIAPALREEGGLRPAVPRERSTDNLQSATSSILTPSLLSTMLGSGRQDANSSMLGGLSQMGNPTALLETERLARGLDQESASEEFSSNRDRHILMSRGTGTDLTRSTRDVGPPRDERELHLVGRPNPYADIPSLYDLYLQAPQRPTRLERFGLEVFRNSDISPELLPTDLPAGPDYVVGPGDSLAINIWGGVSQRLTRTVDREGRVALPEVGPVLVSGSAMADVQRIVQQVLRSQFRDISADVSLARLRTVRVYVVGDVLKPGAYEVSSLSTPLSALFQAGGPTENGSARTLRHFRGKQLVQNVDVYDLLLRGIRGDIRQVQDGDTVLVPPIGPQVRLEGMVRRPAVYELRGETPLDEVLELAGGILPIATLRNIQVQRLQANEKRTMMSVELSQAGDSEAIRKQLESFLVRDGDEIRIFPIALHNQDAVYLQGHALRPGRYSYRDGMRVTDLFSSYKELLPEPAVKYAEIIRLNAPDFRPSVESFDLGAALANPAAAPLLKPMDTVRVFSRYDFEELPTISVGGEVYRPGRYHTSGQLHLRDAVYLAGGTTPDARLDGAQVFRNLPRGEMKIFSVNLAEALAGQPLDNIVLQPRDRVLIHSNSRKVDPPTVYIKGEVAKPGRYPLTNEMRISDLIGAAGGLKRSAYIEAADLTRFKAETNQVGNLREEVNLAAALGGSAQGNLLLRDGDTLAIRRIPGWEDIGASVTVGGEVVHPGTYGIQPGERLSSVLKRAGGFTAAAYPQGIVLERELVRELNAENRKQLIRRVEAELEKSQEEMASAPASQKTAQLDALAQRQRVLEKLREASVSGRLVVRLLPDLSKFVGSPDDIEVRDGDQLSIPKRPGHVLVMGQVYNPNAITYAPRKNAGWYLERAGGPTKLAEVKDIFVIRANGNVESAGSGWWGGGVLSTRIEPGDTIVVPEKPIGESKFWQNAAVLSQVISSAGVALAITLRR